MRVLKKGLLSAVILISLASSIALSWNPLSHGQEEPLLKTIDSTGFAPVSSGNTVIARDSAIEDALRKAIEQALGTFVSSETITENYQILSDNIYTKSQGYIKSYNVIGEQGKGSIYQVTVRAIVAIQDLKNDLDAIGILYARVEKPRMLFMVAEQGIGERAFRYWWFPMAGGVGLNSTETALKEMFVKKGFYVVDISMGELSGIADALRVPDIQREAVQAVGGRLGAEIVIKGRAVGIEGPRTIGSSVGSYVADITIDAIKVSTGEVLATSAGHGVSRHVSPITGSKEAFSKAADEAGERLISQILAKWSGPNVIVLKVRNIQDYKKVEDMKDLLKRRVRGVKAVYQRGFEDSVATFAIESNASANSIADSIAGTAGFNLRISNTTQNSIDAEYTAP